MQSKKISGIMLIALLCSFTASAQDDTYHLVRNYPDIMPISYLDRAGNPTGFETDLMRVIIKRIGVPVDEEFAPDFTSTMESLDKDTTDMIMATVSITEARKQVYEFSNPYFIAHPVTIITKDPNIKSATDLADKRVAVTGKSTHEQIIRDVKGENADDGSILLLGSTFLTVKAVIRGDADAAVGDDSYMLSFVERYGDHDLKAVVDDSYGEDKYGLAIKKGKNELKEKVNQAIKSIIEDGTYDNILKRWYPDLSISHEKLLSE